MTTSALHRLEHGEQSKDSSPKSEASAHETFVLPMTDIDHLFNAPPVAPLSAGLPEIIGVPGTEYLLEQLEVAKHIKFGTLRLMLPKAKITPGVADGTQQALRRYAEYRISQQQTLIRETRHHGWRLTAVATVLLALFLSLSSLFGSELTAGLRPLLRKTLEYGFEIIGWVMFWHPIEVLAFQPISMKSRLKALSRMMDLQVVVENVRELQP